MNLLATTLIKVATGTAMKPYSLSDVAGRSGRVPQQRYSQPQAPVAATRPDLANGQNNLQPPVS